MPNWVRNTVNIIGEESEVMALLEKLRTPWQRKTMRFDAETGNYVWEDCVAKPDAISFHNVVPCPNDDAYHSSDGEGNWYAWNNEHWGTKWDACEDSYEIFDTPIKTSKNAGNDPNIQLMLEFDTAWSPPVPIYRKLREICIDKGLVLDIVYLEEQGWGGHEAYDEFGHPTEHLEWDISDSHSDHMTNPFAGMCRCEWADDPTLFHPDCPGYVEEPVFDECDTCSELYALASRKGRCGDCGNCSKCCEHTEVVVI